jgi:DNA-binding PadR family transcriptional regulator
MYSVHPLLSPVHFSILLALSLKPRHGYELMQQISHDSLAALQIGPGALYSALKRLSSDNLIEELPNETATDRRRQYRITKKGWDRLERELVYYKHLISLSEQRHI